MKKFSASVLIAAVLAITGATAASAADGDYQPITIVKTAPVGGGATTQSGNWPH